MAVVAQVTWNFCNLGSKKQQVFSFFFSFLLLVFISITLLPALSFPSQRVPCLISLMVVYWAKPSTGGLLRAGIWSPLSPVQLQRGGEDIFIVVWRGWGISMAAVFFSSRVVWRSITPPFGIGKGRKWSCWDPGSPCTLLTWNVWPRKRKKPTTYFHSFLRDQMLIEFNSVGV